MLRATHISKKYGDLQVLKDVSLELNRGEIVSIVGSSGAGKSTLLHILGSLDRPDSGTLELQDTPLHELKGSKLAAFRNRHMGFVFQFHHLLPEFTALENICIPAWIAGTPKKEAAEKASILLEKLGLAGRGHHRPTELSGGEQQRVAVARALINQPALVLADEPTGNLDSQHARELHELFLQLRDDLGNSFLIVTHNQELAGMSDRILHMKDGEITVQVA
ncbi:MAG: ABC transporter ATP-binding protein [Chitinophagaceae bacterium]|nr:ABC transporter ATP-binding protein [Chitinophagaceae bacterium]MCA6472810.1 ABC transporter ATP-binding protein [Chitinophagaceae bacterium]MCA6478027.1 ABC transporter ATP-binding protein [Chitinophagaceae bacterium]MCA6479332.1 ABC transporter ATP-binding protein [Chitinophagaceae bacterium]MCA6481498.1 ABC transporter ATP-binding protein [Chitinophagaceae bacterium]